MTCVKKLFPEHGIMWPFRKKCSLAGSGVFRGFTDWHSHILPGVDDGVRTMEEALEILSLYEEVGISEVWLTPHVMEDVPNTTGHLKERFEKLKAAYQGNVVLHLAAEYMLDNLFRERLEAKDLLPLGENADCLLVETSCYGPPMDFQDILAHIRSAGYHPVLAHPERYTYLDRDGYDRLKGMGVRFQLNLLSLTGFYGERARRRAQGMLERKWVDAWGTDIHDLQLFRDAIKVPAISFRTRRCLL